MRYELLFTIATLSLAMGATAAASPIEIPKSLQIEHEAIHSTLVEATKYEQLAEELALHAQTEEEVLYPAALLAIPP